MYKLETVGFMEFFCMEGFRANHKLVKKYHCESITVASAKLYVVKLNQDIFSYINLIK